MAENEKSTDQSPTKAARQRDDTVKARVGSLFRSFGTAVRELLRPKEPPSTTELRVPALDTYPLAVTLREEQYHVLKGPHQSCSAAARSLGHPPEAPGRDTPALSPARVDDGFRTAVDSSHRPSALCHRADLAVAHDHPENGTVPDPRQFEAKRLQQVPQHSSISQMPAANDRVLHSLTHVPTPELYRCIDRSLTEGQWIWARSELNELTRRNDIATDARLPPLTSYEKSSALFPEYRAVLQERIDACNAVSHQLDGFSRDINLLEFAASKGYALDSRASTVCSKVMHHQGTKHTIIISRSGDGRWEYSSPSWIDSLDRGCIGDFVRKLDAPQSGSALCVALREWAATARTPLIAAAHRYVDPPMDDARAALAREMASAQVVPANTYLTLYRGLKPETLNGRRFLITWRAAGRKVLFPHHDEKGLCGFECKSLHSTDFLDDLGTAGLWLSNAQPSDRRLVVTRSAIESLSYHQLAPTEHSRYVSLGHALEKNQSRLLDRVIRGMAPGSTIVVPVPRTTFFRLQGAPASARRCQTSARGAPPAPEMSGRG